MARELRLPELAESVVEGEIVRWLVSAGDEVAHDQPIVEVMTDKVTVEMPSPYAGVLLEILAQEGDVVAVGAPMALFADEDAAGATSADSGDAAGVPSGSAPSSSGISTSASSSSTPAAEAEDDGSRLTLFTPSAGGDEATIQLERRSPAPGPRPAPSGGPAPSSPSVQPGPSAQSASGGARGPFGRVLAVPAARKLARELAVDIERVEGSGPNNRVRVDDVRRHAEQGAAPARPTWVPGEQPEERVPVRGLRRIIAGQMLQSHLTTVRALHVDEADVTELVALRERLKPRAAAAGVKLSYLPFVMKAVVAALKRYPILNSSLDDDANEIVLKHYYNIGLAVATDSGLVVPVVQDVDKRGLLDIAADVQRLAEAARTGKLAPGDVRGGTFSITNIGSLGGLFSFPIINAPEAAILGVHSIKKRPVVLPDDSIVARQMLYLSLSFDHRIVDGAEGSKFTSVIIDFLENPEALLLEV